MSDNLSDVTKNFSRLLRNHRYLADEIKEMHENLEEMLALHGRIVLHRCLEVVQSVRADYDVDPDIMAVFDEIESDLEKRVEVVPVDRWPQMTLDLCAWMRGYDAARRQAVDVLECLEQYYGAAHVLQMQPPEEVTP